MSAGKHTPGPWRVCIDPPNDYWHRGVTIGAADPRDARRVCDVSSFDVPPKPGSNAEANARLIAAAPELLEALERINEWCCYAAEEDINARLMALQQIGQSARAAIAKATGSAA